MNLKGIIIVLTACAASLSHVTARSEGGVDMPGEHYMAADSIVKQRVRQPDAIPVTLKEFLLTGIENNFDILIESNLSRISDNNATYANAGGLPTLDLSAGYAGTLNNTKQTLEGGGTAYNNGAHTATVNAGVNLAWTIFDGFSIRTTHKRLKELQQMGELSVRQAIEDFITEFTAQYYNYVRQHTRMENLLYAVRLSEERVRIVEAHYQIGSSSRLDLQQANVDLNTDRSLLAQQYETMHAMRTLLNQMLGNQQVELPIVTADTTISYDAHLDRAEIEQRMYENNTFLELARRDEQLGELDLKLSKSGRYPYLRLNSGYGYTHNWYGQGAFDRQRNLGLNYGVTLGVNLFDGYNQRRRERNAAIELENRQLSYAQSELALRKTLSDIWMSYVNNMELTKLERANVTTARELYDIAMERYRLGLLSGIELREAQNSLLEAEERLIQTELDTKLCEITLMGLSGQARVYMM